MLLWPAPGWLFISACGGWSSFCFWPGKNWYLNLVHGQLVIYFGLVRTGIHFCSRMACNCP